MDNPMPIWSGIITKAHIKLLKNAGIPQANMIKTIKYIRETLKEHSRTLWKHRCVTLEKETKINKKITTAEAKKFAKKLKIDNILSIERIRNMTNKERKDIFNKIPHNLHKTPNNKQNCGTILRYKQKSTIRNIQGSNPHHRNCQAHRFLNKHT